MFWFHQAKALLMVLCLPNNCCACIRLAYESHAFLTTKRLHLCSIHIDSNLKSFLDLSVTWISTSIVLWLDMAVVLSNFTNAFGKSILHSVSDSALSKRALTCFEPSSDHLNIHQPEYRNCIYESLDVRIFLIMIRFSNALSVLFMSSTINHRRFHLCGIC